MAADAYVDASDATSSPTRAPAVLPADDRVTLPGATRRPASLPAAIGVPDAGGLVRHRVVRRIDRLREVRILALVAPAGEGKTTALAHWAGASPVDVAWLRAPAGAADPANAVLTGIGEALHAVTPGRRATATAAGLIDQLRRHEGPLVLIIDDFHEVARAAVGDLLEEVLLASDVHLALASRTPPVLNLARTELPSLLLGTGDLRFRPSETDELFRVVYGAPLTEGDARRLTTRIGGWAAGLHLFHQATAHGGATARRRALRDPAVATECAQEYVERQVLANLDPGETDLLRRTAFLESLTGRRCDQLLGVAGCERRLRALSRRGVLERQGTEYRLGTAVRAELARALCEDLGEPAADRWSRACADLLETDGLAAAAVRTHVGRGAWLAAAAVVARRPAEVLADPDLAWAEEVPPAAFGNAWLRLARATLLLREGRLTAASDALESPSAAADDPVPDRFAELSHALRVWTVGDVQPGDRWFELVRSALRCPDRARRSRSAQDDAAGAVVHHAVELAVSGDLIGARRVLDGGPPEDGVVALARDLLRAVLDLDQTRIEALVELAEQQGMPWFARVATAITAPDPVASRIAAADARGDCWGALLIAGCAAVRRLQADHPDPVDFEDLAARCRSLDAPALEAWARTGLALAGAVTGLPDAARDADAAVGFAHSAQVPGASAVAWAILGVARNDRPLIRSAAAEAEAVGLGCRPWEWLSPAAADRFEARQRGAAPPLEVRCFGGFEIRVTGASPALARARPRARAVLRMLALHAGRPVHRELLVDAMWPQLDLASGTHNLHVAVSSLRSVLEPGASRGAGRLLIRDADRYLLALPEDSSADVAAFDDELTEADRARAGGDLLAAAACLARATELYVGPALPEDGPAEWVLEAREHYQTRAAEAAARLGEIRLRCDDAEAAAAAARHSIEIDPCRDASWRLLIAAYSHAGDLANAEQARRSYAEVLASLGVVETTASRLG